MKTLNKTTLALVAALAGFGSVAAAQDLPAYSDSEIGAMTFDLTAEMTDRLVAQNIDTAIDTQERLAAGEDVGRTHEFAGAFAPVQYVERNDDDFRGYAGDDMVAMAFRD